LANQDEQAVYSIGAVAHMLDIPTSTIRGWEERYAIVTPNRSRGSQRLFSRSQVEHLRFIKAQIESGKSAADAHRLLALQLSSGPLRMLPDVQEGERRIRILLAERDTYAADLEDYFLRTEGYDVCSATDATHARVLFGERSPDLVVIDLMVSGGAGFGLCAEFTAAGSTPVLAVSSIDMPDEAMLAGASAFLPKPLKPLDLVSAVRDLLGTSALARQARRAEITT
jgi:DNA-binding transcriptional MerR regulator